MYVLMCPCIASPSLRAVGITKDADLRAFFRAQERCRAFDIDAVMMPCSETEFLGPDHPPGPYEGRLDSPEFAAVLDRSEKAVREIIRERGAPLCIVGVDSSPVCGVNRWYRTGERHPGRGVFLSRFPEIPALDVYDFARYRVYLAAPLFSEAERAYNRSVVALLREHLFSVHLPQECGDSSAERSAAHTNDIFTENLAALSEADLVVAVIDGADADSGTAWEMGYAYAQGTPVVALRTDFRQVGATEKVNLMLEGAACVTDNVDMLPRILASPRICPPRDDIGAAEI
ncbi:nucleoside 2-deoxyribosyltransferase [Methanogenium organophilum]|uniref:Nucleoside 2-deoxyribosyltransferase n=1 Tax=Methanogenium organophilum TaxID=2199 RepID=A0A9X9S6D1_METOG|nr:nucleoside 2-deoxyribosyltransferase [Methanogenium organophilum]WAI02506.1 nucleoside 2-deoxyribosyltransferase [Methanogenium organophilum]